VVRGDALFAEALGGGQKGFGVTSYASSAFQVMKIIQAAVALA